jgi:hypothetical protein
LSAAEWRIETGCGRPGCQLRPWRGSLTPTTSAPHQHSSPVTLFNLPDRPRRSPPSPKLAHQW